MDTHAETASYTPSGTPEELRLDWEFAAAAVHARIYDNELRRQIDLAKRRRRAVRRATLVAEVKSVAVCGALGGMAGTSLWCWFLVLAWLTRGA